MPLHAHRFRCRSLPGMAVGIACCIGAAALAAAVAPGGEHWPEFRGPSADGHSNSTGLPATWSEKENIRWKTAIHSRGWSTPVIWGEQIWITTATEDGAKQYVVCVDKNSGRILLDKLLFEN